MSEETYYSKNREKCLAQAKAYLAANRERYKEYHKKYYQENKAKRREYERQRYAKQRAFYTPTPEQLQKKALRQKQDEEWQKRKELKEQQRKEARELKEYQALMKKVFYKEPIVVTPDVELSPEVQIPSGSLMRSEGITLMFD